MYLQNVNFNLPIKDYETMKNMAHESRTTLSELLRRGATLVIEKYEKQDKSNEVESVV